MRCKIVIVALEMTALRKMFLVALLNSLKFHGSDDPSTKVTLITDYPEPKEFETPQISQMISQEAACGISSFPPGLPRWYREQLIAVSFPARAEESYSLMLPVGAFAISPVNDSTLLPRLLARTTWESFSYHPNWWKIAKDVTKRTPVSPWEGPTVLPAICSSELSYWALDIISRENGGDPVELLLKLAADGREWSAMSIYATAAGSRFTQFHHDSYASETKTLMASSQLWSDADLSSFYPALRPESDTGLFTYVHLDEVVNAERAIERLYACLKT